MELRKKVETLENEKVDSTTVNKMVKDRLDELLPPGLMEGLVS